MLIEKTKLNTSKKKQANFFWRFTIKKVIYRNNSSSRRQTILTTNLNQFNKVQKINLIQRFFHFFSFYSIGKNKFGSYWCSLSLCKTKNWDIHSFAKRHYLFGVDTLLHSQSYGFSWWDLNFLFWDWGAKCKFWSVRLKRNYVLIRSLRSVAEDLERNSRKFGKTVEIVKDHSLNNKIFKTRLRKMHQKIFLFYVSLTDFYF